MHNPASVRKNETHKLLWYFGIQTDHRPSDNLQKKKKKKSRCRIIDFAEYRIKLKENEKKKEDKYLRNCHKRGT